MQLVVTFQDRGLGNYATRLRHLAESGRVELAQALNDGLGGVRRSTVAAETAQTGLSGKTITKAQKEREASADSLEATIWSEGGEVRLKYFGAQESASGVLAHPFNKDRVFAHAFMKGGRFPGRVAIAKLNGQVIERQGASRYKTRVVKSGVVIPTEMLTGKTRAAFEAGVSGVLATTIVSKLGALLP